MPAQVIRTCLAAAFDSSNSHDNWLGSLAHELNLFISLGTDSWPADWLASLRHLLAQIPLHCNSEVERNDFEISLARNFYK